MAVRSGERFGWNAASWPAGDVVDVGLSRAVESLRHARLGGVLAAALQVPAWEYLLLFGLLATLVVLLWVEVNPFPSLFGDKPILAHSPQSPTADLIMKRVPIPRFWPTLWLCSPHWQTTFLHFFAVGPRIPYRRQLVQTPDGGTLALDWLDPSEPQSQSQVAESDVGSDSDSSGGNQRASSSSTIPIAMVVPGLSSDSESQYVRLCVADIARLGWRVVVVNHRGLGGVKITSQKLYNAGWTEDLGFVAGLLKQWWPQADLYAVGTSMGGNILAKYLGETSTKCAFRAAVVVGCPWDLMVCDRWMNRRLLQRAYNTALAFALMSFAKKHEDVISRLGISLGHLSKSRSIRQFDDFVTRVVADFETVDAYYRRSSSSQYLPAVAVPTLCISALDDPICTSEALPWGECRLNPNLVLLATHHGGHLSFLQGWTASTIWWTSLTARFLREVHEAKLIPAPPPLDPPPVWSASASALSSKASMAPGDVAASVAAAVVVETGEGGPTGSAPNSIFDALHDEGSNMGQAAPLCAAAAADAVAEGPAGPLALAVPFSSSSTGSLQLPPSAPAGPTAEAMVIVESLLSQLLVAVQNFQKQQQPGASQQEPAVTSLTKERQRVSFSAMTVQQDPPSVAGRAARRGSGGAIQVSLPPPRGQLEEEYRRLLLDVARQHHSQRSRRDTLFLLLHAAVAVAGPLAATAIAVKLQRLRS